YFPRNPCAVVRHPFPGLCTFSYGVLEAVRLEDPTSKIEFREPGDHADPEHSAHLLPSLFGGQLFYVSFRLVEHGTWQLFSARKCWFLGPQDSGTIYLSKSEPLLRPYIDRPLCPGQPFVCHGRPDPLKYRGLIARQGNVPPTT